MRRTESRNPFVNNLCLVADFIYKSNSDKRKLLRKNKKSRDNKSWANIVDEFAKSESKSRADSIFVPDHVKIPAVSKTKVKSNTSSNHDRQTEKVHILTDVIVPAYRCMMVLNVLKST